MQRNVLQSALMAQGYCKEANKSYKIFKSLFIISEVGRIILALQEADGHRDNHVNGILRYELKCGAVIIRSNAVFCLLHETKRHNHRIIKKKYMLEWTSGHHLAQPSVKVR